MNTTAHFISYLQTGSFSTIVTDYVAKAETVRPLYEYAAAIEGIKMAIAVRKKISTNRKLLVEQLQKQYASVITSEKVKNNIEQLLSENTFTIATAHQPNIFTGHLYFIYKILHVIRLADALQGEISHCHFVPVFYMGSEDADLEELGHVYINGEKLEWKTDQTGAVGRMNVDKKLLQLLDRIEGELAVHPFGSEIMSVMRKCYQEGSTIEQATFALVNELFAQYGLVVLLPDNAALKRAFVPVMEKELREGFSHKALEKTIADFPVSYPPQISGREINLFYLQEDKRERIIKDDSTFNIQHSTLAFSREEIFNELHQHPERFSPNVVLRPVFQEMILPNIAFVGGGGEIAYWLQLKKIFEAAEVPLPVLILRNSFLIIEKKLSLLIDRLKISITDLFKSESELMNLLVKRDSKEQLTLDDEKKQLTALYHQIKNIAGNIDVSLQQHVEALSIQALKKLTALEKKMLRAEKKKFETQQRQLHTLKNTLFPNNTLQERIENILPFYAKWGNDFIDAVYQHSKSLDQEFGIVEITGSNQTDF